ncbi:PhoD-like phosphatase N-terminal domain-containing protein, partial [Streptomyces sp. HNM0645]|uniref:PhoD-like phosphatase N-terminal domain-containing protein n=1 Tax=Streptomyces sp. HNM0645 TaxID=2782343 RepID=UPI0024B87052
MTSRVRTTTSRRTVVKVAAATAVAGSVVAGTDVSSSASAHERVPAFVHGVASGDPLPDGVLLWTRVTPAPDALPGSGKGP